MTTALVTGATVGGIGYHIALGLAKAGYDVVLVGRDTEKVRQAQSDLARQTPQTISTEVANLASLASIETLTERVKTTYPRLALLVNNAGVFAAKKQLTEDGIELDMAVNHVAPFLLTWLLLPQLITQTGARVITVNSDSHERARLTTADFTPTADFNFFRAYGASKLADMATIVEMAQRLPSEQVTINAVHPGAVGSNIGNKGGVTQFAWAVIKRFMLTPAQGADTPIWSATAPELATVSGQYLKKRAIAAMNPLAQDPTFRAMVWEQTLTLAHLPVQAAMLV